MHSLTLVILGLGLSFNGIAEDQFDKSDKLYGVNLKSSKSEATRTYTANFTKSFSSPLDIVKKSLTNFSDKCNNSYKNKRQYLSSDFKCKYHDEHLIESFLVSDLKKNENTEMYLVGRQVYDRGHYNYYELVHVQDGFNRDNQKTISVTMRVLKDEEVKEFTTPKFLKDSIFDKSSATIVLTEIGPNKTIMNYEITAQTDHWLLNKEIIVPQVFASISKGIKDLVKSVSKETNHHKRELASQK